MRLDKGTRGFQSVLSLLSTFLYFEGLLMWAQVMQKFAASAENDDQTVCTPMEEGSSVTTLDVSLFHSAAAPQQWTQLTCLFLLSLLLQVQTQTIFNLKSKLAIYNQTVNCETHYVAKLPPTKKKTSDKELHQVAEKPHCHQGLALEPGWRIWSIVFTHGVQLSQPKGGIQPHPEPWRSGRMWIMAGRGLNPRWRNWCRSWEIPLLQHHTSTWLPSLQAQSFNLQIQSSSGMWAIWT